MYRKKVSLKAKNPKSVLMGAVARGNGQAFENLFFNQARSFGAFLAKLPSGCEWHWVRGRMMPTPVKTPFDFILVHRGRSCVLDAKFVSCGNFSYSDLTRHQVNSLFHFGKHIVSGYVICFKEANRVQFINADMLYNLRPRESFSSEDGVYLGSSKDFNPLLVFG